MGRRPETSCRRLEAEAGLAGFVFLFVWTWRRGLLRSRVRASGVVLGTGASLEASWVSPLLGCASSATGEAVLLGLGEVSASSATGALVTVGRRFLPPKLILGPGLNGRTDGLSTLILPLMVGFAVVELAFSDSFSSFFPDSSLFSDSDSDGADVDVALKFDAPLRLLYLSALKVGRLRVSVATGAEVVVVEMPEFLDPEPRYLPLVELPNGLGDSASSAD